MLDEYVKGLKNAYQGFLTTFKNSQGKHPLYKTGENSVFNDSDSMTNAINEIESLYKEAIPALQQIQQMVNNSEAAKITDRLARILSRGFYGVDGTSKNPLTNIIRSKGEADAPTHWQDKLYK